MSKPSVIFLRKALDLYLKVRYNISSAMIGGISMLKRFEVEGFKNFKDKITFDFSDVRDYKFNTECISDGLLGKTIVYGKNSVGKTNLGLAIFDIVSHLTTNNVSPHLYDYYSFAGKNINVQFRYVFTFDDNEIDYSYNKDRDQNLIYDKLKINGKLLFDYNYKEKDGNLNALKEFAPTLNLSMRGRESILRYFVSNTILPEDHPLRKMIVFVSKMLWFAGLDKDSFIGYKMQNKDYFDFIFKDNNLKEFEQLLYAAGVKNGLTSSVDADGKTRLYFKNEKMLNDPNKIDMIPIGDLQANICVTSISYLLPFFPIASSGTKALYNFFYWYKTAADVSLMFIDEFDAYYHYELSETIVKLLEKMSNTQVILTSHNTNLLSNRIMRPDCFFIMTEHGLTSFANATNRELREGHNLEKLYMSGEFDGGK